MENSKDIIRTFTITSEQLKNIADSAFKLGVDYSVNHINEVEQLQIDKDLFIDEIDHSGAALNDIIIHEIIRTKGHFDVVRKIYTHNLFDE